MDDRVAIFIDGSNLYHSVKNNFGRHDMNFTEFANKLTAGRKLFRIYYYNVLQDPAHIRTATKTAGISGCPAQNALSGGPPGHDQKSPGHRKRDRCDDRDRPAVFCLERVL